MKTRVAGKKSKVGKKNSLAICAALAGALLLGGCDKTHVNYPGVTDETPPSVVDLRLATEPKTSGEQKPAAETHSLHAVLRQEGTRVNLVTPERIEADATIVLSVAARDDESGIKEFRVAGPTKLCQTNPSKGSARPLEYDGHLWLYRNYAPAGKGKIPKQVNLRVTFSVAELLRATRGSAKGTVAENGSFQFQLEVTNGSGKVVSTQWLDYRVGRIDCP